MILQPVGEMMGDRNSTVTCLIISTLTPSSTLATQVVASIFWMTHHPTLMSSMMKNMIHPQMDDGLSALVQPFECLPEYP